MQVVPSQQRSLPQQFAHVGLGGVEVQHMPQ
jgi:hypothetical protein